MTVVDEVFVDYRASGRRWRWGLVAAVVLVGLVGAGYLFRVTVTSPEHTVRSYFAALAERDVAAVLRHLAPEVAQPEDPELLDPTVLASPEYEPPTGLRLTETTVDGREAVVRFSYQVAGQTRDAAMRLRRDDGLADALLPRWLVVDGIGSIRVREAPDQVLVNGQLVDAYDPRGPRILAALPGGYRVAVPDDDPLWEGRESLVDVAPQSAADLHLPLVPRTEVREEVTRQVTMRLDACAESEEAMPPGCPFGYARLLRVNDVTWEIARYPRLRLTAGRDGGGTVILVESSRDGEAVITGTTSFGRPLRQTVTFPVSGVATVSKTTIVFRPGW